MQAFEFASRTVFGPLPESLDVKDATEALQAEGCSVVEFKFVIAGGAAAVLAVGRRPRTGG